MSKTKSILIRIKDYLLAGLLILAPIVITVYVLIWSFNLLDGILGPFIYRMIGRRLPGIGLIAGFLITLIAGFITRGWLARRIMKWAESMVAKLPLIRPLYMTAKQLTDAMLSGSDKNLFKKVVLLEYPREGIWSVGFVTSEDVGEIGQEIRKKTGKQMASVFVVSAPNPTTGWLALVPQEEMVDLDISVEQALRLVVSGGYIRPEGK